VVICPTTRESIHDRPRGRETDDPPRGLFPGSFWDPPVFLSSIRTFSLFFSVHRGLDTVNVREEEREEMCEWRWERQKTKDPNLEKEKDEPFWFLVVRLILFSWFGIFYAPRVVF